MGIALATSEQGGLLLRRNIHMVKERGVTLRFLKSARPRDGTVHTSRVDSSGVGALQLGGSFLFVDTKGVCRRKTIR
jgi:hypothetical protein